VNGRIGDLKLVYAAAYLVRNIDAVQDYTNYARGFYADYYTCVPGTKTTKSQCYSPVSEWLEQETNSHDSQELRLSTPDDWRLRGIAGLFWEDYTIHDNTNWNYKSAPGFTNIGPPAGTQVNDPSIRGDSVAFLDDIKRGYHQRAAFGSADFDIVPKTLTVTFGTRYYSINTRATGYTAGSFGCFENGPPPCTGNIPGDVSNLTAEHLDKTYSGFRSRFNLSYRPIGDVLLYYTWSQGFRAGGFNRSSKIIVKPTYTYETPQGYAPDTLVNNEIGWKTEWFDHRLQFNGAVYQENWNNVQVDLFEPCCFGNVGFIINSPSYRVRGAETQVIARATHNLTITGSAAWNSSDLTNSPALIATDGKPITSITDPVGAVGSPLAQSPPFQANLRARYEFEFADYHAFFQMGGTHQAHSLSQTGNVLTYDQPGFTTYDGSLGVAKDAWTVQLYGQNLTDTRADLYSTFDLFIKTDTVNRPRTAGLKFSFKF
jgi:outer membrane receptor protein involved in Fe transport